jgi:hypothetical protein
MAGRPGVKRPKVTMPAALVPAFGTMPKSSIHEWRSSPVLVAALVFAKVRRIMAWSQRPSVAKLVAMARKTEPGVKLIVRPAGATDCAALACSVRSCAKERVCNSTAAYRETLKPAIIASPVSASA